MKTKTYIGLFAKAASCLLVSVVCCLLPLISMGQQYRVEDSASFQKSLAVSNSDAGRINFLLLLAHYNMKKQGSTKADQQVAEAWIGKAEKLNEKLKSKEAEGHILLEKGWLAQVDRPSRKAFDMINKAIELLKDGKDKCLLANAYRALYVYYDESNPEEAAPKTELIDKVLALFNQCGNKTECALVLQDIAENYLSGGNFPLALKNLNESEAILIAAHYPALQRLYSLFGTYYFIQAKYQECLKYEYKALEICKQQKDSTSLCAEVNNIISLSLIDLQQYGQAISYLHDALSIAKKNKDTSSVFNISINLSSSYSYLEKFPESLSIMDDVLGSYNSALKIANNRVTFDRKYLGILLQLHQPDKAAVYAKELLRLIDLPSVNKFNISNTYQALFNYYYQTRDYNNAAACLGSNEKFLEKAGMITQKATNLKSWYKLDSARKDYKGAFTYLLAYTTLQDSLFNEKKSKQIQELQVQHETQKKEDNIKILTQNSRLDQVQLKSARLSRNVTLAAVVVFILIIAMQYRRYREKQKINQLITDKNAALQKLVKEKEWLLKEVHHRVKNNLHTVICLLESQAAYLENDALKAIENSRHRIYAMSLIHQKLYQSDDIKVVDMKMYLTEFVEYLKESYGSPENIQVTLQSETIKLGVAQAIPVSLIINEAINNAFKYAFPLQKKGEIKVELKSMEGEIHLSVTDNGIGFEQSGQEMNSLGLELIKGLTLDLRGTLNIDSNSGTHVHIRFMTDRFVLSADEAEISEFS